MKEESTVAVGRCLFGSGGAVGATAVLLKGRNLEMPDLLDCRVFSCERGNFIWFPGTTPDRIGSELPQVPGMGGMGAERGLPITPTGQQAAGQTQQGPHFPQQPRGPQGPHGPQGPQGPAQQGPQGPPAPQGPIGQQVPETW